MRNHGRGARATKSTLARLPQRGRRIQQEKDVRNQRRLNYDYRVEPDASIWENLLATAIFTPSPHNTQPWRVRIDDPYHATLYMERARTLPDEDTTGHFLRCAMGMFLESLRMIAANAGLTLRDTLFDHASVAQALIPFATLELLPGAGEASYPNGLFKRRVTSRMASNGVRIESHLSALLSQFEPHYGQR
jgi:hypothetical protein